MTSSSPTMSNSRLGFHYFPDTFHYSDSDLRTWLPELKALNATWLTLIAPSDRAIPEPFLAGLIQAGIQPVLHFHLPLASPPTTDELQLLFEMYARWGIKYIALFDRPNVRAAWPTTSWAQTDLVERFLDFYIPLAEATLGVGLTPVFPPLEPGGDYWDTSFLWAALRGIQRRGHAHLLESLVLSAYAWADNVSLEWGAGGPERWPLTRPYHTPDHQQDQRGFYIFDWYSAIARTVLKLPPSILLLGAGNRMPVDMTGEDVNAHTEKNLALAQLVIEGSYFNPEIGTLDSLPSQVLACNFWLLTAPPDSPYLHQAWFQPDGSHLPIVAALHQWIGTPTTSSDPEPEDPLAVEEETPPIEPIPTSNHPIEHYLLLPLFDWGVVEWHLDAIRPYILRHHPTVGFSLDEAVHAKHVTIVGGEVTFTEESVERLRQAGCTVERVSGDGTSIATQMAVL
jgi:hypothetical protein